jgi:putative PIG3 family NAD(P)H quinone oxidoreductase
MRAIVITKPGDPAVLAMRDVPVPSPARGEILVKVAAAALNRADLMQRAGRYPAPPGVPSDIPGLEFSGRVAARGEGAERWPVGARVFGLVAGGAQAAYLVAHQDTVAAIPPALDDESAAAVPETYITAHDAMWEQAGLAHGETVCIHAAGSGVGLAAIQLARARKAVPFGTSRTAAKILRAQTEGLEAGAVLGEPGELVEKANEWTNGRGFDVILDLVGGQYFAASIAALAPRGRLMCISTMAGAESSIDLRRVLSRRLTIRGTALRSRNLEEKIAVTAAFARDVVPLLASGTLRPVIEAVFPMERVAEAHKLLEGNQTFGKVVLTVGEG